MCEEAELTGGAGRASCSQTKFVDETGHRQMASSTWSRAVGTALAILQARGLSF